MYYHGLCFPCVQGFCDYSFVESSPWVGVDGGAVDVLSCGRTVVWTSYLIVCCGDVGGLFSEPLCELLWLFCGL